MSVLVPDNKVFNYVHSGLQNAAYNTVINQWYSHSIKSHFRNADIETESRRLIESWMELNLLSYYIKYKENRINIKIKFRPDFTHKEMNECQMLKYLQCINYNIEPCTIEDLMELSQQQKDDLVLLKNWANEMAVSIVGQMPSYKTATWSN